MKKLFLSFILSCFLSFAPNAFAFSSQTTPIYEDVSLLSTLSYQCTTSTNNVDIFVPTGNYVGFQACASFPQVYVINTSGVGGFYTVWEDIYSLGPNTLSYYIANLTPDYVDLVEIIVYTAPPIVGCMDSTASNYNVSATEDETPSLCVFPAFSIEMDFVIYFLIFDLLFVSNLLFFMFLIDKIFKK